MDISLRVNGLSGALGSTKGLAIALQGARQRLNQIIVDEIAKITRSNFGPSGPMRPIPWAPYSKRYAKKHPGPPTLIRSGVLLGSVRTFATSSAGYLTAQGSKPYAFAHQYGYAPRNLPARPYVPVTGKYLSSQLYGPALEQVQRRVNQEIARIISISR